MYQNFVDRINRINWFGARAFSNHLYLFQVTDENSQETPGTVPTNTNADGQPAAAEVRPFIFFVLIVHATTALLPRCAI